MKAVFYCRCHHRRSWKNNFPLETQRQHNHVRLATGASASSSKIQAPIYSLEPLLYAQRFKPYTKIYLSYDSPHCLSHGSPFGLSVSVESSDTSEYSSMLLSG